jgi:hypothetical protein
MARHRLVSRRRTIARRLALAQPALSVRRCGRLSKTGVRLHFSSVVLISWSREVHSDPSFSDHTSIHLSIHITWRYFHNALYVKCYSGNLCDKYLFIEWSAHGRTYGIPRKPANRPKAPTRGDSEGSWPSAGHQSAHRVSTSGSSRPRGGKDRSRARHPVFGYS